MDLQKLNPWNWFTHEESTPGGARIPVKREAESEGFPAHFGADNPMMNLHQQIDRMFDDAFRGFGFPSSTARLYNPAQWSAPAEFRPSLNVSCDDNSYQITLEAPGNAHG